MKRAGYARTHTKLACTTGKGHSTGPGTVLTVLGFEAVAHLRDHGKNGERLLDRLRSSTIDEPIIIQIWGQGNYMLSNGNHEYRKKSTT